MTTMIAGLVLFLGTHLVPAAPPLRRTLAAPAGERRYKAMFSVAAGLGLVLVIVGYAIADRGEQVFAPVVAARRAAPLVVTLAFILLAASHMRGHLRHALQHPMVIGVVLWSGVHLLANGDLRGTILFGSFLGWSLVDLVASYLRGRAPDFTPAWRYDAMAIVGGVVVAAVVMMLHPVLFGVRPV